MSGLQSLDNTWLNAMTPTEVEIMLQLLAASLQILDIGVKSLSRVLKDVGDVVPERNLTEQQEGDLQEYTKGCRHVLSDLDRVLAKYRFLDTSTTGFRARTQKLWIRLKFEPEEIKDLRFRVTSNVTLLNHFIVRLTSENLNGLVHHQAEQHRLDVIKWLCSVNFSTQHNDLCGQCQEGSGQWLLESPEFRSWILKKQQTLYCPGIPGAGKTMLSSVVIEHLRGERHADVDSNIGIAFLYCSYKRQGEQKLKVLLASLLQQLVRGLPSLPDEVDQLQKKHLAEETQPSINEIKTLLCSVTKSFPKISIVIDALDECVETERKQLLNELFRLQAQTHLNIFATSRDLPEIKSQFSGCPSLEIRAAEDDMRRYLENHIHELKRCVVKSSVLQEEIISQILEVVDGMFLLANLHLESLRHKMTVKDIKNALKHLPKGSEALNHAYAEAIERIQAQPQEYQELAKRVISWITLAQRPLSVLELRHALAVEIDRSDLDDENLIETEDLLSGCAGLVVIDDESGIIRLVHYTAQEYFQRLLPLWNPDAHPEIVKICIAYLSFDVFAVGPTVSGLVMDERIQGNLLLSYAATYWSYHYRHTSDQGLDRSVLHFFEKTLNLQCVSEIYMSSVSECSLASDTALHAAALYGLPEIAALLLANGHPPDLAGAAECTPLMMAALVGQAKVADMLASRDDVDKNVRNPLFRTPLSYAAEYGHGGVVEILAQRADVDAEAGDFRGQPPLCYAAAGGHEEVVRILMQRDDINANARDQDGMTALFYAASHGHESTVRYLLQRDDVDAGARDNPGRIALHLAAGGGHEGIVKLLIEDQNIKADVVDESGWSPLMYATGGGHSEVVEYLARRDDVNVNKEANDGSTALDYKHGNGFNVVGDVLKRHGALTKAELEAGRAQSPSLPNLTELSVF